MTRDQFEQQLRRSRVRFTWAPAHRAYLVGDGTQPERVSIDEIRNSDNDDIRALIERTNTKSKE